MAGNAAVYECCSGSQAQNISLNLAVNYGAQDSSFSGGTGQYRMPQAGDLVVVFAGVDNTAGTPNSISDSKGNTWTAIQTQTGAVNQQFRAWGSIIAAGKVPTASDTITAVFASTSGSKHLIAKVIVGPTAVTATNQVTAQGSGGGTWSSGASGAITGTKIQIGVLQNASGGGKPTALTFDAATATFTQAPSGHWSAFMVDTAPPAGGQAAGGTTASGTWAAGTWTHAAPAPVTGTGTLAAKKPALAGSGTYTAPVTGTGTFAAKKAALSGSGTYTAPVTGTGTFAAKKIALSGSGVYGGATGTGALAAKKIALSGTGTYTAPVTGTGSFAAKKIALSGTGSYIVPVTGTGTFAAKKIKLAGSGTVAGITGTGALAAKKIALSGTGVYTPPVTGTASWAAKKIKLAGSGTYTPPSTGTGTFAAKKIRLAGTGLTGQVGTGTFAAKKIALSGAGISNIAPTTGVGAWHSKKIALHGVGTIGTPPAPPRAISAAPPSLVPVIWDGLALNEGERSDGLCTVVTAVDGWYGSPPLDGNDLARVLTDGALFGYKTLGARLVTISGGATGPRDLLNAFARNLAGKAAGRQPVTLLVGEDDGSDNPRALTATARADSDTLAFAWRGRVYFTYQAVLTCGDPRLYDSALSSVTITALPSGAATGRVYPWNPPRFYASASVANAAVLANPGNAPAPVLLTYTGPLSESRLTDGKTTIHLAALGSAQQIFINSETLATTAPGGASRAAYLLAGTAPLTIPPHSEATWNLYGTGTGTVQLAYRAAWT